MQVQLKDGSTVLEGTPVGGRSGRYSFRVVPTKCSSWTSASTHHGGTKQNGWGVCRRGQAERFFTAGAYSSRVCLSALRGGAECSNLRSWRLTRESRKREWVEGVLTQELTGPFGGGSIWWRARAVPPVNRYMRQYHPKLRN